MKPYFISEKNITKDREKQLKQLYKEINPINQSLRKYKRSYDFNHIKNNQLDIQVKGIDSRIDDNYKLAKETYRRISFNKSFLNLKKKEINKLFSN